jgi:antirestriction protein
MYVIYKNFEVHRENNVLPIERKSGECSMADKFEEHIEGNYVSCVETFSALFHV